MASNRDGMERTKQLPVPTVPARPLKPCFCALLLVSSAALIGSACREQPDLEAARRDAIAAILAGPWQGRSERGNQKVVLTVSPEGTYDWRQMPRGGRTPLLAHTGRWETKDNISPEAASFTLHLVCDTIYFDAEGKIEPGRYELTFTRTAESGIYRLETPWGVFRIEHVPAA